MIDPTVLNPVLGVCGRARFLTAWHGDISLIRDQEHIMTRAAKVGDRSLASPGYSQVGLHIDSGHLAYPRDIPQPLSAEANKQLETIGFREPY
jgi:hypothetical protein